MISLPLLFLWKCSDDCQYRCMWGVVETFQKKGWPPPQFHGKVFVLLFIVLLFVAWCEGYKYYLVLSSFPNKTVLVRFFLLK